VKARILIDGDKQLRAQMEELSELAYSDKLVRGGMSDAARIIARSQKNMAPVRKNPMQKKFRSIGKVKTDRGYVRPDGPLRLIPPGLLKRSIGFRVKRDRASGTVSVVVGANVGKKKRNPNNAPHAAFVGSGTIQRFSNKFSKKRVGPLRANRGIMPPNDYISVATNFAAPAAMKALEAGVRAEIAVVAGH
jgi:hypothetical protein